MVEIGINPNQVSYTAMIDGYSAEGKLDVALSLFGKMEESDCYPSIETYNVIISGLFEDNRFF
jgi:pentatricopeptide repeat protein